MMLPNMHNVHLIYCGTEDEKFTEELTQQVTIFILKCSKTSHPLILVASYFAFFRILIKLNVDMIATHLIESTKNWLSLAVLLCS